MMSESVKDVEIQAVISQDKISTGAHKLIGSDKLMAPTAYLFEKTVEKAVVKAEN